MLSNKNRNLGGDLLLVTCMGCYVGGHIYLSPERISECTKRHGFRLIDLIHIVWVHEEMHSLLNSNIHNDIEEHTVQTMTAACFEALDRTDLLDTMDVLSKTQPNEYGLFAENPNRELLPLNTVKHAKPPLTNYSNKRITGFSYNGKNHIITRWSDLLVYLIADMNIIDSAKLIDCMTRLRLGMAISDMPIRQSRPIEVPGVGLFVEGRMNADRTVKIAYELVQEFDAGKGILVIDVY